MTQHFVDSSVVWMPASTRGNGTCLSSPWHNALRGACGENQGPAKIKDWQLNRTITDNAQAMLKLRGAQAPEAR